MVDVNEMVETLKGGFDESEALVLSQMIAQAVRKNNGFLRTECMPLMVTYSADPEVEAHAEDIGVKVYWSFELIRVLHL